MKKLPLILGIICIVAGISLLAYLAVDQYFVQQTLTLSQAEVAQLSLNKLSIAPLPSHVFIDKYVNVDVEPLIIKNQKWAISKDKATYLYQSARPGEPGNIIIYGHNLRNIFGPMRYVHLGDVVIVTTADGREHQYKIVLLKEVSPRDTTFLLPTRTETLTMYTCSGFLDSRRFIVRAEAL